jgi:glucose-6-phosphate isomerase
MLGKSSAEAKAELEKSGVKGEELKKILPHKVLAFFLHI